MARKRLFGSKGPLIYATIVSLICVMSASISTFAWFQAEANVQVQTSSTSATITVENPNESFSMTVYQYNGGNPYKPSSIGASVTWAGNFTTTGGSVIPTKELWPGYAVTFCLVSTTVTKQHSLSISSMPSDSTFHSSSDNRYLYSGQTTSTHVDIRWASLVFGKGFLCSGSDKPSASDIANYLKNSSSSSADCHYKYPRGGSETYDTLASVNPEGNSRVAFMFLTFYFNDDDSTWFMHVDSDGQRDYTSPSFASGTTYWQAYSGSGSTIGYNSEVYSGLQFRIGSFTVA